MILFNYLELKLPDPRKFVDIANMMACSDAIDKRWRRRERKLVSLKRRAREQRRLDWESNTRRRKRRKELQRHANAAQAARLEWNEAVDMIDGSSRYRLSRENR